ncbi:hypothetical protein GGH12_001408 [Coemansia sp. RSA 1822]|nr:hypothetical protein LPJ76_001417 [Coemansia sp. RSA 638]KAJ2120129.1 hypothetical protein IW147_005321 [Coemansia sp. RSA 720]KAJ2543909.1 hypothetical protein GGF49_001660 [Coemansia sp. RSA 1853]KAJ2565484.1 hypothetical protein GGH12_001408 [Coemansia sp. RSA 1822]
MQGPRSQQRSRNNGAGRKRAAEPEEFPPLSDESYSPPPYTELDQGSGSSRPVQPQLVSIAPGEYYHPASFPGYTTVQLANGGEAQALLPRSTASIQRSAQTNSSRTHRFHHRQVRRRRGCIGRCCGRLCSLLCFIVGLLIVSVFVSSVLYVARHVLPPSWDWQCASLEPHSNQTFDFPLSAPLRIESVEGMSISNVYVAHSNSSETVHVRAVIEANRGNWRDRIVVESHGPEQGSGSLLAVRVVRPQWEWPRDCVRASLYVSIPLYTSDDTVLPSLHISTGTGLLRSLDSGNLALGDLILDMRSGLVQLRNMTVHGALLVSTSNGRINATDVDVTSRASFSSTNGALSLTRVRAERVTATTNNASIRVADVVAETVALHTVNAPVSMRAVTADNISVMTTNGAIRGNARISSTAVAQTSNGAVALEISGPPQTDERQITVRSSNNVVELGLTDIEGSFDVTTSNSRAAVTGDSKLLNFRRSTDTLKSGSFGDANSARISVSTSNAHAELRFAP